MPDDPKLPLPSLDLDALEREGGTPDPFRITLGGREYLLPDPKEQDYLEVLEAQQEIAKGNARKALEVYVPSDDREAFFANRLPAWKLDKLLSAYHEHFGLPSPGNVSASST